MLKLVQVGEEGDSMICALFENDILYKERDDSGSRAKNDGYLGLGWLAQQRASLFAASRTLR
jgi:hypothetical protein